MTVNGNSKAAEYLRSIDGQTTLDNSITKLYKQKGEKINGSDKDRRAHTKCAGSIFLQKVVDKIVFYVIIETEVAQQMLRNKRRRKRSDDKCRQNANLQEMR